MPRFAIPLGYRFRPKDEELISYLYCKAIGKPLPNDEDILDVDLYNMNDPGKLFKNTEEETVYVFTRVKKVSENGKRVDRKVTGNRTWSGVNRGKPIRDTNDGRIIGEKKNFNFINKLKTNLGYRMTEYAVEKGILCTDYVLCQIKKLKRRRCQDNTGIGEVSMEDDSFGMTDVVSVSEYTAGDNTETGGEFNSSVTEDESFVVANVVPVAENTDGYSKFLGLQQGGNNEEVAMLVDTQCFMASSEEQGDDLAIWAMIDDLISSSPSGLLSDLL